MVGLCAVVDAPLSICSNLCSYLRFFNDENIYEFEFGRTIVACVAHDESNVVYVSTSDADILLFGSLHTIRGGDKHKTFDTDDATATIRTLYEKMGPEFVSRINGEFVALIETDDGVVRIATDRLSKKPLFTTPIEDGIAISTSLLSLLAELNRPFTIKEGALQEYFVFNCVFGTETPIQEIDQVPPASITTVGSAEDNHIYWQPLYTPQQWNSQELIERMSDLIATILDEQLSKEKSYGLLLSGGSDSRLFLSQANNYNITAYTLGDWWSREVDVAHTVAMKANVPFRFLRRSRNYHQRVLNQSPRMCDFVSRFDQAHALGFADRLKDDVDAIINGMFADTFFKGHFLPVLSIDTPIGEFDPPIRKNIADLDSYISYLSERHVPEYLEVDNDIHTFLSSVIKNNGEEVIHHGVEYSDLQHAIMSSAYYPLTNQKDILLYQSLNHTAPTITPFLDDRLIDLHLSIPVSMQLRGNLINRTLTHLSEELATVPHSGTNVSPSGSFMSQFLGYNFTRLGRNLRPSRGMSWYSNDPWPNKNKLIRETDFISNSLIEYDSILNQIDTLNSRMAHQLHDAHISGNNHWEDLYLLATVLNMPGVEKL